MPYLVIATFNRPDPSIEWPHETSLDPQLRVRMEEDIHTLAWGRKYRSPTVYPDELTAIYESVWDAKLIYDSYRNIPSVKEYFDLVDAYCQSTGITYTLVTEEI